MATVHSRKPLNCGSKYINPKKGFRSYFLSFEDGARIEIMHQAGRVETPTSQPSVFGFTHLAFTVGSKEEVDQLTNQLREDGYTISSEPRTTGDGYYESVILDSEGNCIEISE